MSSSIPIKKIPIKPEPADAEVEAPEYSQSTSSTPSQGVAIPPPLSLYIHIPWCVRKCPYCDFNSHEARHEIPEKTYVDALLADL
ncbi:MAG TPA: hypothetical protein VFS17_03875, partial [Methylophilaceae bacterium]|nr:hypothetical protein [Methylophilaceae bacterium]